MPVSRRQKKQGLATLKNQIRQQIHRLFVAISLLCAVSAWSNPESQSQSETTEHLIVPKDSLWKLAADYYADALKWPSLWALNTQVEDPDLIYVGEILRVPADNAKTQAEMNALRVKKELDRQQTQNAVAELDEFFGGSSADSLADSSVAAIESPNESSDEAAISVSETTLAASASASTDEFRSLTKQDHNPRLKDGSESSDTEGYQDRLLDPSTPEDTAYAYAALKRSENSWQRIDHAIEALALYRSDNITGSNRFDEGLQYTARLTTANLGTFRLNLIALNELRSSDPRANSGTLALRQQDGIVRASLEQYNVPITESISMDNVFGTHRQARNTPFRERPSLINYRFSAAEPDILGVSSRLRFGTTGVSFSAGKLGQTRGSLLPGFVRTEGNVKRLQYATAREKNAVSLEAWQTDKQTELDNRTGYRASYDHLLSANTVLSASVVGSDSSNAFLLGGSTQSELKKHDYGLYYFEQDLLWIDTRIGDDNAGGFYRYTGHRGTRNYGASLELRRDGLTQNSIRSTDSGFLNLTYARRLNRRSTWSNVYSYRHSKTKRQSALSLLANNDPTRRDHAFRTFYSRTHRQNSRSQLGALYRTRTGEDEYQITYGWSKDLQNDSTFEVDARQRFLNARGSKSRESVINARWNRQFANGNYLGIGAGYTLGNSDTDDNRGFTGYANWEQRLTRKLDLSVQLDYSRQQSDFETDLSDTFFTGNAFEDENLNTFREFTALMRLSYRLGGRSGDGIIASRNSSGGSGSVRGFLYIDANGDGERQANEQGIAGVTVFLNSVYPVITDARGAYSFPNVGPGDHFLFIDETTLPLPWTLQNSEYTPVRVDLRRSTRVNIAVSPITIADAGE